VNKSRTKFGSIKFYVVNATSDRSYPEKVYAEFDSNNNVKRYYSFYPDKIVMTDERAKNLSYTVTSQKLPDSYDSNIYHRFSRLDTLIFDKAQKIIDTTKYSSLKRLTGAEGYLIEVNYYHGFPKNRKFQPL
jgi:hypothetical protein